MENSHQQLIMKYGEPLVKSLESIALNDWPLLIPNKLAMDMLFYNFQNAITYCFFANSQLQLIKMNKRFQSLLPENYDAKDQPIFEVFKQLGMKPESIADFRQQLQTQSYAKLNQIKIEINYDVRYFSLFSCYTEYGKKHYWRGLQGQFIDKTKEVLLRKHEIAMTKELQLTNTQLTRTSQQLKNTLDELTHNQEQLIHAEKMAALGQLIAGIAHELNTPLGAIKASNEAISDSINTMPNKLINLLGKLNTTQSKLFFRLLKQTNAKENILSSREERQLKRHLISQLEQHNFPNSDDIADYLVDIGNTEPDIKTIQTFDEQLIPTLEVLYGFVTLQNNHLTIKRAVDRAAKIVIALKTFVHVKKEEQLIAVNVPESIDIILTIYENQLKHKIELQKEYEQDLPLIWCHLDQLQQVWTNIIANALQAMEAKGKLGIKVSKMANTIVIKFRDNGPGIPDHVMPHIFEPFYTTKAPGEGTGIGLDISKKIITQHGGTITAQSQPGITEFTVTLPINQPPDQGDSRNAK